LYHYKLKVVYEDKLRKRFGKVQGQNDADAEDEATAALVNGVVGELSFGELVKGDAVDVAAEDSDSSDESSEYESGSDDESEETSEESSEEVVAQPAPRLPLRSNTVTATPRSPLSRDSSSSPTTPRPRSRSFSLKSKRSMTFSIPGLGHKSTQSADMSSPPVPPLPKGIHPAALHKPLPPSPSPHSSLERIPSTKPSLNGPSRPPGYKAKKKKPPVVLTPPKLEHIPQLLPVFKEMMRPLLRPRER